MAAKFYKIDTSKSTTIGEIIQVVQSSKQLVLCEKNKQLITKCRNYLDKKLADGSSLHYGINTGFGSLCDVRISPKDIEALQHNLIRSHACGIGDLVTTEIVKIMLLIKIQSLSYGNSGVRLSLVEKLIEFYNKDILPVIYELGSLGASGDLAPLAHLSLPLIGEGNVYYKGEITTTKIAFKNANVTKISLASKEGLAMLNGTQFSTAYAIWELAQAQRLFAIANTNVAFSLDAFDCHFSPFDERLQKIRPHSGQQLVANKIKQLINGSKLIDQPKAHVQDPYAFRCVPQVHGASYLAIQHAFDVVTTEINSVTDNPNIFPDDDVIISGGNFHAQPIALVLDYLAIAIAELGNIAERRIYQLLGNKRELPPFLSHNAGLHSGFMIAQYTAAAIVSQNKQYCTPASVDSIVSCNGQEDHVSMAANAATKCLKVINNVERLLAIEWMTVCQALEFRDIKKTSPILQKLLHTYRKSVSHVHTDRILSDDFATTIQFLREQFPLGE